MSVISKHTYQKIFLFETMWFFCDKIPVFALPVPDTRKKYFESGEGSNSKSSGISETYVCSGMGGEIPQY